jgi:hypothetical protein
MPLLSICQGDVELLLLLLLLSAVQSLRRATPRPLIAAAQQQGLLYSYPITASHRG